MEDNTLDSILSDEGQPEVVAEAPPETVAVEAAPEPTGEVAAPPAVQDEDRSASGLVAAAVAERQRRQAAEHRAQELEKELASYKQKPAAEGAPDPSQYTDTAQYIHDLVAYQTDQKLNSAKQQWLQEQQAERFQNQLAATTDSVVKEGRTKYPDFDDAVEALRPVLTNENFHRALVLKGGTDVSYWLAKNPTEAYRVSSLPPQEMLLEIAELRGLLRGKAMPPTAPVAPKPAIPQTLTQSRDSRGQFQPAYEGPTPLDAILSGRN